MSVSDLSVEQKACMPKTYTDLAPYSWDVAQEKSKCSGTKPNFDIIVVVIPA
jgi:hypothetical protein